MTSPEAAAVKEAATSKTAGAKPTISILMTSFNRRETTLACLAALPAAVADCADWRIVLVDDGSSDGTGAAVCALWPDAVVVRGSGDLYWNGGMRLAWRTALPFGDDFVLWLNDDTQLRPGAIADMISLYRTQANAKTVIVGCTVDPRSGALTYGGYRIAEGWSRLRLRRLSAAETECDTFNGNCVLIPRAAATEIGINAAEYRHAYGDNDYGLRARRTGWRILELKSPVAVQERNERYEQSLRRLTLRNWRFIFFHPKGLALREWLAFCRAHGGRLWPVNFVLRYLKMATARPSK